MNVKTMADQIRQAECRPLGHTQQNQVCLMISHTTLNKPDILTF